MITNTSEYGCMGIILSCAAQMAIVAKTIVDYD
jgi:hypothetical protein